MSERQSDDDPGDEPVGARLPSWWLRAVGAALVGLGLGLRFALPSSAFGFVGWVVAILGAALALFGGEPAVRDPAAPDEAPEEDDEPAAPEWLPMARIGLGAAGAILFLYGVAKVGLIALDQERASLEFVWIVGGASLSLIALIWTASSGHDGEPLRLAPPSATGTRWLIVAGVMAALALQIAIPATYYQGDDIYDERFAWRMFSAVRVYRCDLSAIDLDEGVPRPVNLTQTIHVAWINTMRRNREGVLQRYLTWRCENAEGIDGARVTNRCVSPEGERVPAVVREIDCATERIVAVEVE